MPQIALLGCLTTNGGTIAGPGGLTQFADGITVSIVGDLITPHYHGKALISAATIITGSPDTFVNGKPLVRIGDACSCGCLILSGDNDAFCI